MKRDDYLFAEGNNRLKLYRDSRMFGGKPRYYVAKTREKEMVIPDNHRRAVAFVCYRDKLGKMRFAGTCFFLGLVPEGRAGDGSDGFFQYTITAKHVIVAVKSKSGDRKAILRVNLTEGGVQYIDTNADDWLSNTDDPSNIDASDVAILDWFPRPDDGYNVTCIMDDLIQKEENVEQIAKVGLGDDVAIVGLFANHTGKQRNAPIVRVGNVALLADEKEKVETKVFGFMEAHLIECRSIGGLSGSPVFVHMTGPRIDEAGKAIFVEMRHIYLLGLVHGHYDVALPEQNEVVEDNLKKDAINMGIAIVVPAKKITEVLNLPKWVKEREEILKKIDDKKLPTHTNTISLSGPPLLPMTTHDLTPPRPSPGGDRY